jgi:hypothetical protein
MSAMLVEKRAAPVAGSGASPPGMAWVENPDVLQEVMTCLLFTTA